MGYALQKPVEGDDKRRETRLRVLLPGKIIYHEGTVSENCAIVGLSASGACLRVAPDQNVPPHFDLLDIRNKVAYEATVAWTIPPLVGVHFEKVFLLDRVTEAHDYLRRVWVESRSK
jgi:hypothetical protein